MAKPLAGGLPIGAVLLSSKVADCVAPGDHGSTFAGAPLICAAANYVLDRVSQAEFLSAVQSQGERLRQGLERITAQRDLEVRGCGLLLGVVPLAAQHA